MRQSAIHKYEAMGLFSRLAKLKASTILSYNNNEDGESTDHEPLLAEAKKQEVFEQARTEVLNHIRRAK